MSEEQQPAAAKVEDSSAKPKPAVAPSRPAGPKRSEEEWDAWSEATAGKPSIFWEADDGDSFLVENKQGMNGSTERTWDRYTKDAVKSVLRQEHCIALKAREGEFISEFERLLLFVRRNKVVDLSTASIAGYGAGLHKSFGQQILVRRSARVVKPAKGDCDEIKRFIESRLNIGGPSVSTETETPASLDRASARPPAVESAPCGPQQAVYFHGWCKASLEARLQGSPLNWRPGQGLIFAGPSDCGKSRLQHNIITPLLGGRSANPGPYLFGATDFNAEIAAAEHLLMEDPSGGSRNFERVFFGEQWKQLIVADTFRLHRKREDAVTVSPFYRSTISVNDDPDKMRVLPLLTPDMREKVMLFQVSDAPIPFALETMEQRAAFVKLMREQIPAYAWWLLHEFELPAGLFHKRYGVRQWLHPTLAQELFEDTPAAELLAIVDAAKWGNNEALWDLESKWGKPGQTWGDGHLELERLLLESTFKLESERLLKHNKLERLLSRLKEDEPDRVIQYRTHMQRGWLISAPAAE